ncbi:MAG: hypothetical protein E7412_00850 [Ruminococcaceae bacterium]|nr:hypothetical protein [Oscillospiraceae bacterium]
MKGAIKSLVKNDYVVSVICKILGVVVAVAYSALLARYLGPSIKGEIAYITGIVSIFSIVLTIGVHQAYPYYKKRDTIGDVKHYFMNAVLLLFGIYSIISLAICIFCIKNSVLIICILLSLISAYKRIVSYVYLVEAGGKRNVTMLVIHIVQVVYILILFLTTESNFLLGISVVAFQDVVLAVVYTKKIRFRFGIKYLKGNFLVKLVAYGIVPMISLLASTLNYRIDILMLRGFNNITIASVGIYSVGVAIAEEVLLIPEAIKEILLSKLAKGANDEAVATVMRLCFPICLLMFAGLACCGWWLINIFYGEAYLEAYPVLVITMIGVTAIMFYKMIATYNIVNKKQNFNLIVLLSSITVNVIANFILIPRLNIAGAAIATVISYIYCAVVFLMYFSRRSGIKIRNMVFMTRQDILTLKNLFSNKKKTI